MSKTRSQIKSIINDYKDMLGKLGINVSRTILYGSFLKGKPREDSDIDLIVISEDFQKMNLRERLEVLGIAAIRIMQPIEANGYTAKETEKKQQSIFLKEILKIGVAV